MSFRNFLEEARSPLGKELEKIDKLIRKTDGSKVGWISVSVARDMTDEFESKVKKNPMLKKQLNNMDSTGELKVYNFRAN